MHDPGWQRMAQFNLFPFLVFLVNSERNHRQHTRNNEADELAHDAVNEDDCNSVSDQPVQFPLIHPSPFCKRPGTTEMMPSL
jgi:hypothetical protein